MVAVNATAKRLLLQSVCDLPRLFDRFFVRTESFRRQLISLDQGQTEVMNDFPQFFIGTLTHDADNSARSRNTYMFNGLARSQPAQRVRATNESPVKRQRLWL